MPLLAHLLPLEPIGEVEDELLIFSWDIISQPTLTLLKSLKDLSHLRYSQGTVNVGIQDIVFLVDVFGKQFPIVDQIAAKCVAVAILNRLNDGCISVRIVEQDILFPINLTSFASSLTKRLPFVYDKSLTRLT